MKRFLLIAMLFATLNATAQTSTEQEQATQIAQLQQEVAALNEQVATLQKKGTTWDKITKALPKISGYAQIRYDYNDGDGSSSFRLRRVRLSFDGNITSKIDYKLQAELTSFKLLDAYFSYKPVQEFSIRVGQFKLPFSIENTDYGPTKLEFIDYPMALTYLVGYDEGIGDNTVIKANGRDLGAKFYGAFGKNKVIGYDIGVFNGNGLNTTDNNKSKDVVGRLSIRPVKGLLISGSYMWGEYGSKFYARERWGFGICYDRGNIVARTEYIGGRTGHDKAVEKTNDEGSIEESTILKELTSDGWYLMAGYRFCKNWMVAARYDTFTENSDTRSKSTTSTITGGLTWQPVKYFKLQANYVFTDLHRFAGAGKNTHSIQVQAAAMF